MSRFPAILNSSHVFSVTCQAATCEFIRYRLNHQVCVRRPPSSSHTQKQLKAIKSNWKQSKAIHSNQCSLLNAFNCFWLLSIAFNCFWLLLIAPPGRGSPDANLVVQTVCHIEYWSRSLIIPGHLWCTAHRWRQNLPRSLLCDIRSERAQSHLPNPYDANCARTSSLCFNHFILSTGSYHRDANLCNLLYLRRHPANLDPAAHSTLDDTSNVEMVCRSRQLVHTLSDCPWRSLRRWITRSCIWNLIFDRWSRFRRRWLKAHSLLMHKKSTDAVVKIYAAIDPYLKRYLDYNILLLTVTIYTYKTCHTV